MIQKLLRFIRVVQFTILIIIIGLELAQIVGFGINRDSTEFPNIYYGPVSNKVPWAAYFEDMNVIHGIKVYYYITIPLTFVCPQFFWKRFNGARILSRDKYYEYFYLALWFAASLANLKPVYNREDLNCDDDKWGSQSYRCKLYISSAAFSFFMTITWVFSTLLLHHYLIKHKDELPDRAVKRRNRSESA